MKTRSSHLLLMVSLMTASLLSAQPARLRSAASPVKARMGINLNGVSDWNTEQPFVDAIKQSRNWISQQEGASWGKGPELETDENGWVTRLEPGAWVEIPLFTDFPDGAFQPGVFTVRWEGKGKVELSKGTIERSGSSEIKVLWEEPNVWLRIKEIDPDQPLRNLQVIYPGFEKDAVARVFDPGFMNRWKHMEVLRYMDWQHTNNSSLSYWGDRTQTGRFSWSAPGGVPVEVMILLSNRMKVDPWFCMPHLADDEFIRSFAELVRDRLDPSLKVYLEYSNEVWNSQFQQNKFAGQKGIELGFAERPWEAAWKYYAHRSGEIFQIWEEVFGGTDRLVRVISSQAANSYVAKQILSHEDIAKHTDALAIAPYISFNLSGRTAENRPDAPEVESWTVNQVLDYIESTSLPNSIENIKDHKELADEYGLDLICYEAGQHLVGIQGGENNKTVENLLKEANRHPRMGQIYLQYMDGWKKAGGGVMALFSSVGRWTKWGSWSLTELPNPQPGAYPKYDAVIKWMRENH